MENAVYSQAIDASASRQTIAGSRTRSGRFIPLVIGLWMWCAIQALLMANSATVHASAAWTDLETAVVILVASTISSVAGFAFAALAGIGLALLTQDPVGVVHTIVVCSIATQLYCVWQLRAQIRLRVLTPMLVAGALTVPCGTWLLMHVHAAAYRLGLGAFLMAYGAFSILHSPKRSVRVTPLRDALAGALAGFVGGLTAFPGALMTIWCSLRGIDKTRQRAIYQPFILAMQIVTAASLHVLGRAQLGAQHDLRFVAFAICGATIGYAYFRRLSGAQFRVALNVLLIVSGVGLLATALTR
ncbi:MAG TPA: sulfite exporter TauE/SafE family protein [Casimicrobiaceae bacterium]|nr:sulfite exporter TauE/SafE family protein [Casimicrobiaceae bacterium]